MLKTFTEEAQMMLIGYDPLRKDLIGLKDGDHPEGLRNDIYVRASLLFG